VQIVVDRPLTCTSVNASVFKQPSDAHLSFAIQFEFFPKSHPSALTMVIGNSIFAAFTLITIALALDPTPSERAKWDAVCMESRNRPKFFVLLWFELVPEEANHQTEAGQQYRMTFDANGSKSTAWS